MSHQVITISPDGSVRGLQVKNGKGLDLRQMGKTKIKRVTLIEWDETYQRWYIRPVDSDARWNTNTIRRLFPHNKGEGMRYVWNGRTAKEGMRLLFPDAGYVPIDIMQNTRKAVLYFEDYELAVTVEVAVLYARMLKGEGINAGV